MQPPDAIHRTRDTAILLRSGLNLIQQALSIYSVDMKLIVGNRQFKAMFDLPAHLSEPGALFSDTIRHLAETGEYGRVDDIDAFVTARVAQAQAFEPHYLERKRANGRWISVEGGPLRQGGWVTVYTDITQVRQQEEMLRSRSDELSDKLLDRSEELQERYTYSNQRLPLTAANGADDIIGHTAEAILGRDVYGTIAPALRSALNGEPKVVEFANPTDGHQIRAAFTPDTNTTGQVTGAYVLSMDISRSAQGRVATAQDRAGFPGWTAHLDTLLLHPDDGTTPVPLSLAEAALLRAFLQNANRLMTRAELQNDPGIRPGSERALDIRISRLRQKLNDSPKAPKLLRTIYGAGYIFTSDVTWD